MRARRQSGFTLIEAMIALALLAIVIVKVTMVLNTANTAHRAQSTRLALEDQAFRVLDQIAMEIMGADRESLIPDPESPFDTTQVDYEVSLGVDENGEVIYDAPERISLLGTSKQIAWTERPGLLDERRVIWCNAVAPYLEGELVNGVDDNDNGLVDERGLSIVVEGSLVTIRLTLERVDKHGNPITTSVNTQVSCRN